VALAILVFALLPLGFDPLFGAHALIFGVRL
jgi:hypothetical protein